MKVFPILSIAILLLLVNCSTEQQAPTSSLLQGVAALSSIEGKPQYLASPFATAGDRVYLVGFQNGSFPDIGWHITGEMGGIWDHPIKLMDGFAASVKVKNSDSFICLDKADKFTNYPAGNNHHFTWQTENIEIDRSQFVPDGIEGVVVEFKISNKSSKTKDLQFFFTGMIDLRPTWLGERTNMTDAEDEFSFDEKENVLIAKDKNNPWFTAFCSSFQTSISSEAEACSTTNRKRLGKNATLSYDFTIPANQDVVIPFFIAGSYQSEAALRATINTLKTKSDELVKQKLNRFATIKNNSHLTIADKNIEQMYEWLKYNVDWLTRDVAEQGRGLGAGLPDYPWWFGADASYALQGALATGNHELARTTILLLHKLSQKTNSNGRIIHEVSTNGAVYNKGNVNETAQFVTLVNNYFAWTGDKALVVQLFPDLEKGLRWLIQEKDPDGNHYPNGSGMMEIPGLESELEMIDVATYTQQAFASGAVLAKAIGENDAAAKYQKLADELKLKINREWWLANDNSFGDFRGTVAEANTILNAALIRSDTLRKMWAVAELKNMQKQLKKYATNQKTAHVIYHNWAVNTPMETGIADSAKANAALATAKKYENLFGAFVTGIDRTEEADSVVLKSRKKIFSYTGAVMTLPTSVLAVGAARYGHAHDALTYIKKLNQSFSYALPGSMYEVSPDFGMMTQAWNIYGVAIPIVQYFFGITPNASEKTISISPNPPSDWKDASLENVKVGDNSISISISKKDDHIEYKINQTLGDWRILFQVKDKAKVSVNSKEIDPKKLLNKAIELTGKEIIVNVY